MMMSGIGMIGCAIGYLVPCNDHVTLRFSCGFFEVSRGSYSTTCAL
jgi:hypothetical protein